MKRRNSLAILLTTSILATTLTAGTAAASNLGDDAVAITSTTDIGADLSAMPPASADAQDLDELLIGPIRKIVALMLAMIKAQQTAGHVKFLAALVRVQPLDGPSTGESPPRAVLFMGQKLTVVCERRTSDGRYWGFVVSGSTFGWLRGDRYTVPGRTSAGGRGGPASC